MVVHQHEGVDCDTVCAAGLAQQAFEVVPVIVIKADRATVHSALGLVQRDARKLESWCARHRVDGLGASAQRAVATRRSPPVSGGLWGRN